MATSAFHWGLRWPHANARSYPVGATHSRPATLAENPRRAADVRRLPTWPLNESLPCPRQSPHRGPAVGHRHLYNLLSVHDILRRQGVTAAFRVLTDGQIADALDACAYFDLHDLAAAVAEIPVAAASPLSARVFDTEYRRRFTMTDRIVAALRERIATLPEDFPPDAT